MNETLEAVRSRLLFDDSGEFEKALLQLELLELLELQLLKDE